MTAYDDDAPARPARGGRGPWLREISVADYVNPTPERQAQLSQEIDRYFNTPLHMFPFSETTSKPDRFYDFYEKSIAERFPDDQDMRDLVSEYGRGFFKSLTGYVFIKRLLFVLALVGTWLAAIFGPPMFANLGLGGFLQVAATIALMLVVYPIFAGINALIFMQYRISLENRSYELSRQIIQRTRELQNLYATVRAMPDQEETHYQTEGDAWGARSAYLIRLLMWVAQRMEYLEKFIQVEMWRVRRERYWINWAGGGLVFIILGAWLGFLAFQRPGATANAPLFFTLLGLSAVMGLVFAWSSYHFWKTPLNIARDKLGADGWVRYATLDLDNTVGDQVSRDKKRLVEYRTLNKGR